MQVELNGFDELQHRLEKAQQMDLSKAHEEASRIIKRSSRPPIKTGRLAASLTSSGSKDSGVITSSLSYSAAVHWGTNRRPPRPFILNAATATEPQWIQCYTDTLNKLLS